MKISLTNVIKQATSLLALSLGACSGDGMSFEPGMEAGELQEALWLNGGATLWTGPISVCFTSSVNATRRTTIQNTLENGWERAANINFYGFGTCPTLTSTTTNMIAVSIDANTPAQGISEHCTTNNNCPSGGFGRAPAGDFNRIRFISDATAANPAIVLHEFGHALGFLHESNDALESGDPSPFCDQRTSGGTSLESESDVTRSVMTAYVHVCNPDVTQLSSWDILGARRVYGMKAPGTVAGVNGLVLNIKGGLTTTGTPIIAWDGDGANWNSSFKRRSAGSLLLTAKTGTTERVLNVKGGGVSANALTPLISWSVNEAHTNSQFRFQSAQWLAMGDRCVMASKSESGAELAIDRCTSSNLQKWDFFDGDRRIRLSGTNLCVNVPNNNTANGTKLILYPCSTGAPYSNETFGFANGKITYSGKAFNVQNGTIAAGNRIMLWTPGSPEPYSNERFTIRGQIKSLGQCVDMEGGAVGGTNIGVRSCSSVTNPSASLNNTQVWEYWF